MCPSRRLVALPGALLDDVTVRLGAYTAQAELVNASMARAALATTAKRIDPFIERSFPRSYD
jgi:hypothetical protein